MKVIGMNKSYKDFELILPSFRCDKGCPYCSAKITKWPNVDLVLENFEDRLRALKENGNHFKYFILCGNGEPSLYSDSIWEKIWGIVGIYRSMFDGIRVQTSGNLFYDKYKLSLLPKDALIEITRVYEDSKKDMSILNYKRDYLQTDEASNRPLRLNYVVMKDKTAKQMMGEINSYVENYPNIKTVSIKTLNLNTLDGDTDNPYSQWILKNACSRNESDKVIKDLTTLLGEGVTEYNDRVVWTVNGVDITLYQAKGEHYGDTHVVFYGDKLVDFELDEYLVEHDLFAAKPITGTLNKRERKFVVTKPEDLEYSISTMGSMAGHSYLLQQYTIGDTKYRKIKSKDGSDIQYTKNTKSTLEMIDGSKNKSVSVEAITEEEYIANLSENIVEKNRQFYMAGGFYITVDTYIRPYQDLCIVEVWDLCNTNLPDFKAPKGWVEVTGNELYDNKSLASKSLSEKIVVLEGTDLIGKTTLGNQLIKCGYRIQDRDLKNFSNNVMEEISIKDAANEIVRSLEQNFNKIYLVMYTTDDKELEERLEKRSATGRLSIFDDKAVFYNYMYRTIISYCQTYNITPKNLISLDCTHKNEIEVFAKAIEILKL